MTTLLYKWLTKDRKTTYQDSVWPAEVGIWTPDKVPRMCASGWHLATHQGISEHAKVNCVLWVAEGRGVSVEDSSKIAFESARLVTEIGVLEPTVATKWAADCAKRVLKNYEDVYPNDFRPREAIKAAKKWAKEPTEENRNACNAACNAAYAAYAAADNAACNAAYAAYAAADNAACNAAAYAADAKEKERIWQSDKLLTLMRRSNA